MFIGLSAYRQHFAAIFRDSLGSWVQEIIAKQKTAQMNPGPQPFQAASAVVISLIHLGHRSIQLLRALDHCDIRADHQQESRIRTQAPAKATIGSFDVVSRIDRMAESSES